MPRSGVPKSLCSSKCALTQARKKLRPAWRAWFEASRWVSKFQAFRAYRSKEGGAEEDLQWRPMRKGIADRYRRTEVSQKANERLLNALATVDDSRSVEELTADIQKRATWGKRKVRIPGITPLGRRQGITHGYQSRRACCEPMESSRKYLAPTAIKSPKPGGPLS